MGRRSRKRSLGDGRHGGPQTGAAAPEAPGSSPSASASSRAERDAERRRRRTEGGETRSRPARGRPARRATRERPQAPWGTFPLTEIVVLLALILCIAGFAIQTPRGQVMLVSGLILGSLAGLELAAREHFAGYRSHTTLLSACAAAVASAVMVFAVTGPKASVLVLVAALAVFAIAFHLLRKAFKRRSGGLGFR